MILEDQIKQAQEEHREA